MIENLRATVQSRIDVLVASGREVGVQVAAYLHGELIVDACAGTADLSTGRPVTPDTPFFSYSTGKGLAATAVHVLAEHGHLDYDLRIADVWPEYARHGKGATTLRHALAHTAGVPALPADTTPEDFADWERMCAVLADSVPEWPPGEGYGYHAWTFGWLVGEVVRRATGRTLAEVLAEDVAAPLGVAGELFFGVPDQDLDRLAILEERDWAATLDHLSAHVPRFDRLVPPGVRMDAALGNRRDLLRADLPATGTVTARAVARMYAALLGEVDGVRLISPDRLRAALTVTHHGPDWAFGQESPMGLGYALLEDGTVFGTSGLGGSLAYAVPGSGLTVAATKNMLAYGDGDPMEELRVLIQEAVG
ncbi:serine hydrolase domain-containing protein [Longispora urticae]